MKKKQTIKIHVFSDYPPVSLCRNQISTYKWDLTKRIGINSITICINKWIIQYCYINICSNKNNTIQWVAARFFNGFKNKTKKDYFSALWLLCNWFELRYIFIACASKNLLLNPLHCTKMSIWHTCRTYYPCCPSIESIPLSKKYQLRVDPLKKNFFFHMICSLYYSNSSTCHWKKEGNYSTETLKSREKNHFISW